MIADMCGTDTVNMHLLMYHNRAVSDSELLPVMGI